MLAVIRNVKRDFSWCLRIVAKAQSQEQRHESPFLVQRADICL